MRDASIQRYVGVMRLLHWVIALIVMSMLSMGFFMEDFSPSVKPTVFLLHKSMGLTVLMLMIVRVFSALHYHRPLLPERVPTWEVLLSQIVQKGFYILLIAMPLSGWIMSTAAGRAPNYFGLGLIPFPGISHDDALSNTMFTVHQTIAWLLIVCVVLHLAGALKHYLVDKDRVLQTMF